MGNDNCNERKDTVLRKKIVLILSVLIQLNLYIFLNGASKKIIDNRINYYWVVRKVSRAD